MLKILWCRKITRFWSLSKFVILQQVILIFLQNFSTFFRKFNFKIQKKIKNKVLYFKQFLIFFHYFFLLFFFFFNFEPIRYFLKTKLIIQHNLIFLFSTFNFFLLFLFLFIFYFIIFYYYFFYNNFFLIFF